MNRKLLTSAALIAAPLLWASGAQAGLQITLGPNTAGTITFMALGSSQLSVALSGVTGTNSATFNVFPTQDVGTYSLANVTFTATLSGTNFTISPAASEGFHYTTAGGSNGDGAGTDTLDGTAHWNLLKDNSLKPNLTSTLLLNMDGITSSGDSIFTGTFPTGALASIDITFTSLSLGVNLDTLAGMPAGTSETASISSGEVVPAPPIGQGLPIILGVAGMLFGVRVWTRSNKRSSPGTAIPA